MADTGLFGLYRSLLSLETSLSSIWNTDHQTENSIGVQKQHSKPANWEFYWCTRATFRTNHM